LQITSYGQSSNRIDEIKSNPARDAIHAMPNRELALRRMLTMCGQQACGQAFINVGIDSPEPRNNNNDLRDKTKGMSFVLGTLAGEQVRFRSE
jgi:hypothetical protein